MQLLTIVLLMICNGQNPDSSTSGTSHNKFSKMPPPTSMHLWTRCRVLRVARRSSWRRSFIRTLATHGDSPFVLRCMWCQLWCYLLRNCCLCSQNGPYLLFTISRKSFKIGPMFIWTFLLTITHYNFPKYCRFLLNHPVCRSYLLRTRNNSDEKCRENQSKHFLFNNFFLKIVQFLGIVWKNMVGPESHRWQCNATHALFVLKN